MPFMLSGQLWEMVHFPQFATQWRTNAPINIKWSIMRSDNIP